MLFSGKRAKQGKQEKQQGLKPASLGFPLFDMHCHMLASVDDGAENEAEMYRMLDLSYEDGIRMICFTPHFQLDFYGDNCDESLSSFEKAKAYAKEKYPDLSLFLGNELFYHADALSHLMQGTCRTLNGSRYVLMDFNSGVELREIRSAVTQLLTHGYRPVLAHLERYPCFGLNLHPVEELCRQGCLVQVNASSFDGEWGRAAKKRAEKMLSRGVVYAIASDAHHAEFRAPGLSGCAARVAEEYGEGLARRLFYENPLRLMKNERVGS